MLSSVTLNCQVTKIVVNSGFQLSGILTQDCYQMSQVSRIVFVIVFVAVVLFVLGKPVLTKTDEFSEKDLCQP